MDELPLTIPTRPVPAPPPEPPDPDRKRRMSLAVGLAVMWGTFTLLAQLSGALDAFEDPLLDWRLSLTPYPAPQSNQLALVAIDNITPDKPWPWSRLEYSLVLRSLIDYAPQSVVFEMNLNDRDTDYSSFDTEFSHMVERANTVVFAATVLTTPGDTPPPATPPPSIPTVGSMHQVPRFSSVVWPLDTFAGSSPVGVNNIEPGRGFRLRRLPLIFLLNGRMVPSLALQAAAQYIGADLPSSRIEMGRTISLRNKQGKVLRTVPIDEAGRMLVRFRPEPAASWQASVDNLLLYDDQLQNNITPEQDPRVMLKRQVWIGRTDPAQPVHFKTGIGLLSPVEVQMAAERTILDQDYVRPLPPILLALLYLVVAVGGAAFVSRFGPIPGAAMLVIIGSFWIESAMLLFRAYNLILPLPSFGMLIFGTFAMGMLAFHWDLNPDDDSRQMSLEL